MKKIPTLFLPDKATVNRLTDKVNPECQWVLDDLQSGDPSVAIRRKYDGICCRLKDGKLWERCRLHQSYCLDNACELIEIDDINHEYVFWRLVDIKLDRNADHKAALAMLPTPDDGTYELLSPDIKRGVENVSLPRLMRHDHAPTYVIMDRSYESLRKHLKYNDIYGYVFVDRKEGRLAKVNRTHFGLDRYKRNHF